MKTFIIDEEALKKGWGDEGEYWFSLSNYTVSEHRLFAHYNRPEEMTEETFMLSLGYIPYFRVRRIDLAKAYIAIIPNNKLRAALAKVKDTDYIETFWKYFNAYPAVFDAYEDFQNTYLLEKAKQWCEAHEISYEIV